MSKLSENEIANIFSMLENLNPTPNNPLYRNSENIVFGEEQANYFPIPGEERNFEYNKFYHVKSLANKITTQLYSSEKFGDEIKALYTQLIHARQKRGFVGLRGKNKKGIILGLR